MGTKTIEISDELYRELESKLCQDKCFKEINLLEDLTGEKLFIRTVTYHLTGKLKKVIGGNFLELTDAAWIADSGRFMQCIQDGSLNEVEPVGKAFVNMNAIVDFFPWKHPVPTKQK